MTSQALIDDMRQVSGLLQAGSFRSAHDQLQVIVADNPGFVEGLRLFAGAKQALGDVASAETLLRQALALDPNWVPTLATLGELLMANGRATEAEPLLLRAVSGTPAYPRAALVLARYYNDVKRPGQALAVAGALCESGNADADLAAQHIAALAALGRQDQAVAIYRRIVAGTPANLAAMHALAIALDVAGQQPEAERVARQTLASGHTTASVYNTLARTLIASGDFAGAEAALRDCLQREPRRADAHSNLARLVWMRTGDSAQATAILDQALHIFANDDALRATKAAILQGAGDARAAYDCLAEPASRPLAPPALLVRAGLAALEFDSATALILAERALRAAPADTTALNLLVAAQLGVGDARAALAHCETLLVNSPDDQYLIALQTTAWRLLGDARYAQYCDYAQLAVPYQLEAPSGWPDLGHFFADLKRSLAPLHNPHGHALLFQSLRNGTETTGDLARNPDAVIQALFKMFDAPIRNYLERIGAGADPLRRRNNASYRFNGGWSVRLRSAGYHNNHVHPRGWISSACYIELPESMSDAGNQEGCLVFGEPSIVTSPPLAAEHSVHPQAGMLVLFPSYFWHGTVPFTGTQTRLTVAFDVVPGGQV